MPDDRHAHDHPRHDHDDALDRALRDALGPDGPWDEDLEWLGDFDVHAARAAVVHGVRRRRARRLQAVTAVAALVVVVGLVVSQVVATTAPSGGGSRAKGRPASATGATATIAQCRLEDAAPHSCGTVTGAPQFSALANGAAAAPTSAGPVRHGPEVPAVRVLHATVGKPVSVVLPLIAVSLWARPTVATSSGGAGTGPVVGVTAAPATSVRGVHGWDRFVIEPEHVGAATIEATGTCRAKASAASCKGGRTYWVLEVEVAGT